MARKASSSESSAPNKNTTDNPNQPVHQMRFGRILATFWQNENDNGVWFNVNLSRLYRDGDQWRDSQSFGRDDLLPLAEATRQAWHWILQQQAKD